MQEQKKFRYVYNGKEVDRKQFEELAEGSFKWFEGNSIVSVPFSSFDSFFDGEYRSNRQINNHIKSILDLPTIDCKFTMCGQKNCICCYPTKNTNSTRHKSQAGETHKEIVGDLEGINRPPSTHNDLEKYINSLKKLKDDVITNSNRGEKETLQGLKYNNLKPSLDIVINRQFPKALQLIALATEYGHKKYMENDFNYLNYKSVKGGSQTYFDANARHSTDRNGLDESGLPHIIHAVWSSLAGLELWAEENNIDVKEFTEKFMKNLHNSK